MKELLKFIRRDFDLENPNTTFVEVSEEINFITETFVDEYNDLFVCLRFLN